MSDKVLRLEEGVGGKRTGSVRRGKARGGRIEDLVVSEIRKELSGSVKESSVVASAWEESVRGAIKSGAVQPLYDKVMLDTWCDRSNKLNDCIGVYERVISGVGYRFVSTLSPDESVLREQAREHLSEVMGRMPSEEELEIFVRMKVEESDREKAIAERFFRNCGRYKGKKISFVKLKRLWRKDLERTGEYFAEVLREEVEEGLEGEYLGFPKRLVYVPSVSILRMPFESFDTVRVVVKDRLNAFSFQEVEEYRTFRRFVQINPSGRPLRYFKELGDERIVSSASGKVYRTLAEMKRVEGSYVTEASELFYGDLEHSRSAYGRPRWLPNSPAVSGNRQAAEMNESFFENNGIPPIAFMVNGGYLSADAADVLAEHLEELRGADAYHGALVLEAMPFNAGIPGMTPHKAEIKIESLRDMRLEDATHLEYQRYNDKLLASNFTIPPILLGLSEEYTRATAEAALRFFEENVARPERSLEDSQINAELMEALDLTLVVYESMSPEMTDAKSMKETLDMLLKNGVLTPEEGRFEAEKMLNRELGVNGADWAQKPIRVYESDSKKEIAEASKPPVPVQLTEKKDRLGMLREMISQLPKRFY